VRPLEWYEENEENYSVFISETIAVPDSNAFLQGKWIIDPDYDHNFCCRSGCERE